MIPCEGDCWDLNWVPINSTILILNAISENKCVAADSISIAVEIARKVYFPNAFSPNNDGKNDYFTVLGAVPNIKSVEKMLVYDRWGTLIFEKTNFSPNEPTEGWDGTYKGKPLGNGSFVYMTDILFLDDVVIRYTGNVTIVK